MIALQWSASSIEFCSEGLSVVSFPASYFETSLKLPFRLLPNNQYVSCFCLYEYRCLVLKTEIVLAIHKCAYPQPGLALILRGWYLIIRISRVEITLSVICSYFLRHFLQVTVTVINQLLEKIRQDLPGLEKTEETELIRRQFENTIHHVQLKKESPEEGSPSYEDIRL